jgi:hypothetical protein
MRRGSFGGFLSAVVARNESSYLRGENSQVVGGRMNDYPETAEFGKQRLLDPAISRGL